MKYRIEECEVCGIMNPTLVIRGWADSTINHIKICLLYTSDAADD